MSVLTSVPQDRGLTKELHIGFLPGALLSGEPRLRHDCIEYGFLELLSIRDSLKWLCN